MAKNPITASERRGIIAVAALALLICGAGLWLARCGRPETTVTPEEVEVLLDGSSARESGLRGDSSSWSKEKGVQKKGRKKVAGAKKNKEKGSKIYKRRSHLDEHVDQE